jgi:hypothetical protein
MDRNTDLLTDSLPRNLFLLFLVFNFFNQIFVLSIFDWPDLMIKIFSFLCC